MKMLSQAKNFLRFYSDKKFEDQKIDLVLLLWKLF